jgi:hypothetical protein
MTVVKLRSPEGDGDEEAETFLNSTLAKCEHAAAILRDLINLADATIAVLAARKRAAYQSRLAEFRLAASPRAQKPTLDAEVIQLFKARAELTAREVHNHLQDKGIAVEPKQVFNALDYLRRKGRIERRGPGRYYLTDYGVVVETLDDLGIDDNQGGCE